MGGLLTRPVLHRGVRELGGIVVRRAAVAPGPGLTLIIYFARHYFFAHHGPRARHVRAVHRGGRLPPQLVVLQLMFLNNLQAGLTHYGATTVTGHLYRGLRELPRSGRVLRVGAQSRDLAGGRGRVVEGTGCGEIRPNSVAQAV